MKQPKNNFAFSSLDLLIVIAAIVVLGLCLLLPTTGRERRSARISCVNNLKQVGLAVKSFEIDNGMFPMQVPNEQSGSKNYTNAADAYRHFALLIAEIGSPKVLICPKDSRTAATSTNITGNSNISYFINLQANAASPSAFLVGDRNITTNNRLLQLVPLTLQSNTAATWTKDIHNLAGNIAFCDGSARQLDQVQLKNAVRAGPNEVQTLLIP